MNFLKSIGLKSSEPSETYNPPAPPQNTTNCSTNHHYFEKKGEINECKKLLKSLMEKSPVSD